MESSHLVIFSISGKFITKFNVLRCISLSETLFWTGARVRIPKAVKMLRSSTQLVKSHGDDLGQEYLWNRDEYVLWKTVCKQWTKRPNMEDNQKS